MGDFFPDDTEDPASGDFFPDQVRPRVKSEAPPGGWPTEPGWGVNAPPRIDWGGPSATPTPADTGFVGQKWRTTSIGDRLPTPEYAAYSKRHEKPSPLGSLVQGMVSPMTKALGFGTGQGLFGSLKAEEPPTEYPGFGTAGAYIAGASGWQEPKDIQQMSGLDALGMGLGPLSTEIEGASEALRLRGARSIFPGTGGKLPIEGGFLTEAGRTIPGKIAGAAEDFILPPDLAKAAPRYKQSPVAFESDLDRALYIVAQTKPSRRDADYLKLLMEHTGNTEGQVRAAGQVLRAHIGDLASRIKPGDPIAVPDLTGPKPPPATPVSPEMRQWLDSGGMEPIPKGVTPAEAVKAAIEENRALTGTVEDLRHAERVQKAGLLADLRKTVDPKQFGELSSAIMRGKLSELAGSNKMALLSDEAKDAIVRSVVKGDTLTEMESFALVKKLETHGFTGQRMTNYYNDLLDYAMGTPRPPKGPTTAAEALKPPPEPLPIPEALKPDKPVVPVQQRVSIFPPELTPKEILAVEVTPKIPEPTAPLPEPSARMKAGAANIEMNQFRTTEVGPGLGMESAQRAANARARIEQLEGKVREVLPKSPEQRAGVPMPESAMPAEAAPHFNALESLEKRGFTPDEIAQAHQMARDARGGGRGAPPPGEGLFGGLQMPSGADIGRVALSVLGLSRVILTGFDTGITLLRQGWYLSWNPGVAFRTVKGTIPWILHEDYALARNEIIQQSAVAQKWRPYFPALLSDLSKPETLLPGEKWFLKNMLSHIPGMEPFAKGALTQGRLATQARQLEVEAAVLKSARKGVLSSLDEESRAIGSQEEAFPTKLAGRIPIVRISNRGYTGFLNELRYQKMMKLDYAMVRAGRTSESDMRQAAGFVGAVTGRANLGKLEASAGFLAAGFFAPRSMVALFEAPFFLLASNPIVRKEAAKDLAGAIAGTTAVLTLLKISGAADVETDPRSSDYGKVRIGKTRIDVTGGYQKVIRTAWQLIDGHAKTLDARGEKAIHPVSRIDTSLSFGRGKLAPPPGSLIDFLTGSTVTGDQIESSPAGGWKIVQNNFTPMMASDLYQAAQDAGLVSPQVALTAVLGNVGAGVSTFKSLNQQLNEWLATQPPIDGNGEPVQKDDPTRATYWSDLNSGVASRFRNNTPEVDAIFKSTIRSAHDNAARTLRDGAFKEQRASDSAFLGGTINGRKWEEGLITRSIESGELQKLLKEQGNIPEANSHEGKLLKGYYDLVEKFRQPDGSLDTAALADAHDAYLSAQTPSDVTYITKALHPNATPLVDEYWKFRAQLRAMDWNHAYQRGKAYKALGEKGKGYFDEYMDAKLKGESVGAIKESMLAKYGNDLGSRVNAGNAEVSKGTKAAQRLVLKANQDLDYEMAKFRNAAPNSEEVAARLAKETPPDQLPKLLARNGARLTNQDLANIRLLLDLKHAPTLQDIISAPVARLEQYGGTQDQAKGLLTAAQKGHQ